MPETYPSKVSACAELSRLYICFVNKDFSAIGHALSASARSVVLNALMDGSSRPASELAAAAGVSASTASEHLAILCDAGLIVATARGRQRFYRLAGPSVADALEQLGHLCPSAPVVSYRQSRQAEDLAQARLCYDHLAGRLGVALTDAMVRGGWLREGNGLEATNLGLDRLGGIGLDISAGASSRRPLCRACPDWTERRPHLAGRLGALLAGHAVESGWVRPARRGRGLTVTAAGREAFGQHWSLDDDMFAPG